MKVFRFVLLALVLSTTCYAAELTITNDGIPIHTERAKNVGGYILSKRMQDHLNTINKLPPKDIKEYTRLIIKSHTKKLTYQEFIKINRWTKGYYNLTLLNRVEWPTTLDKKLLRDIQLAQRMQIAADKREVIGAEALRDQMMGDNIEGRTEGSLELQKLVFAE